MNLKEMYARLKAISKESQKATGEELDKLIAEAEEINTKIQEAKNRAKLADFANSQVTDNEGEEAEEHKTIASKKGEALKAGAAIKKAFMPKNVISTSNVVLADHNAEDIKPAFNEVSTLVDRISIINLPGGERYKRGFVKSYAGEGGYTAEGAEYTSEEPTFDYVDIDKTKITAYCEEPDEINKLAPAAYDNLIENSIEIAIKKKFSREILNGDGTSGHLTGIFNAPSKVIDPKTDIALSGIDNNTLTDIIYGYGGDEDVESVAVLILNKSDLHAFATCTLADGKKAYNIVNNGNTGTIDGVPYIIHSSCGVLSSDDTDEDEYCMAYGPLSNYEGAVFSDIVIAHSKDFKFKTGQICHRGDIYCGGNVAAWNGFLRVKKAVAE